MSAWTQILEPGPALLILLLAVTSQVVSGAPFDELEQQSSEIEYYPVTDSTGCYYNFQHYDEGDRIITNEPCLNCTCHNEMLMCYLRVCPFTKAVGQDCKMEKRSDQCCPVITCPEVPVHLLEGSTTPSTAVGHFNEYGCSIDNLFYADGAKVPSNPNNPCEVCYCIRNKTACIIQECTLTGKVVEGCSPVYVDGVCCPVRYNCDHPQLETTPRPLLTTTTLPPTSAPTDCIYHNEVYADGALVKKDVPCEQCYCMRGDIVCAVQECGPTPLDKVNCTALPTKEGQCCPDTYECKNISEEDLTTLTYYEAPTTQPTIILSNDSTTASATEQYTTTAQLEEQFTAETERQLPEAITESTEDRTPAPFTESSTIEAFTSSIAGTIETITSRVTDIVEAVTSTISGSKQEASVETETESKSTEAQPAVTEQIKITEEQTSTDSGIEKETTSGYIVTESTSQDTESTESEESKPIVTESVTEMHGVLHDDEESHDREPEEEDEDNEISEGSGRPTEEQPEQHVSSSATPPSIIEDKHITSYDHTETEEQPTTEQADGEIITPAVTIEPQLTIQTEAGITTTEYVSKEKHTTVSLESDSHIKETTIPQVVTEESIKADTTAYIEEGQGTTQKSIPLDSEAQETIQPLEPERTTEHAKPDSSIQPGHGITEQPERTVSETDQPIEKITTTENIIEEGVTSQDKLEPVSSVQEVTAPTEPTAEEESTEKEKPSATGEPERGTERTSSGEPEPDVEEGKPITTTEKEGTEVSTEIPIKETESPESIDNISETASVVPPTSTELETDAQVTEKLVDKETTEKSMETTEIEKITHPAIEQSEVTTETSEGKIGTDAPSASEKSEICSDTDCKSLQGDNEKPTEVQEACTKEGCIPQEKPIAENCINEQDCIPSTPDKEYETTATEKIPADSSICDTAAGCTPGEVNKTSTEVTLVQSTEGSDLHIPTIETITDEIVTKITDKQTDNLEGSGEEDEEVKEHPTISDEYETTTSELLPGLKPEEQTEEIFPTETEREPSSKSTEPSVVEEVPRTTVRSDLEKVSEVTPTPDEEITLPKETTPQEIVTPETSTEKEVVETSESDLAVSPIGPKVTEVPETIDASTTEPQEEEGSVYTKRPEGAPETPTESVIQGITEHTQQTTESEIIVETTSAEVVTTENVHTPEISSSGGPLVTEVNIPQDIESSTQAQSEGESKATGTPSPTGLEEETSEKDIKSSTEEGAETGVPVVTEVPETTPSVSTDISQVSVGSDITESVKPESETETSQSIEIVGITEITVTEETTLSEQEKDATEKVLSEGTEKGPEFVTETFATTEQSKSESTEIADDAKLTASESPQESTSKIASETLETTEQVPSKETLPEVSQYPVETEAPVFVTEPEAVTEHEVTAEHGIPGEGSCLVDGQTYKNNSHVPPINQCQSSCKCLSSILKCESIPCTPPPSNLQCTPMFLSPDACCPEYTCTATGVTSMESDSHVVETTTVTQEEKGGLGTVGTQGGSGEEPVTSEVITEPKHTTVQSEIVTETVKESVPEQTVSEPQVTEQLPTKPTEAPVSEETTRHIELISQTEAVTEMETVATVTETETKEVTVSESDTFIPDERTTVSIDNLTRISSTEPSVETIPSQDETEKETPEEPIHSQQCSTDGCSPAEPTPLPSEDITSQPDVDQTLEPDVSKEPEVISHTTSEAEEELPGTSATVTQQPQEQVEEKIETVQPSDKGQEDLLPFTTERTVAEKESEENTDVSITEKSQDDIIAEQVTDHSRTTIDSGISPDTATETSEEPSKTPEEIAAMPEIEEAVTTPSVLTITDTTIGEISPKVSEQTTVSTEGESKITTEEESEVSETVQPIMGSETETTASPPQVDDSATPVTGVSEETETPYNPAISTTIVSIEHAETTPASKTATELEYVTESETVATISPLEVEAHITETSVKESEKPDLTQPPEVEISPENTSEPLPVEDKTPYSSITPQTETLPEEVITQRVPTIEEQPSKPVDSEQEEPALKETSTTTSALTEPSTDRMIDEEGLTEKTIIIPDAETEVTTYIEKATTIPSEIGEFSTHAPIHNITESEPTVTGTEEETTKESASTESEQQTIVTEETVGSKATEETTVQETAEATTIKKEEPIYTSPQLTTQGPLNVSELYTSGPQIELSTKKSVEGELSTSVPVTPLSTSEPPTLAPPYYTPGVLPGHDLPEEKLPDYPTDEYEEDQSPLGPGTCRYGGKVYVSAQQIPRDDPCDFCFCFRSDIICLQQSCPPPIPRCHEEPIRGFCCPRYECPVGMATAVNLTTSTTTTTTTLPPHFLPHAYQGRVTKSGCQIKGRAYQVGDVIPSASGPCLHCTCGGDGEMKCDPKACSPEPMLRQMIAAAASRRRR